MLKCKDIAEQSSDFVDQRLSFRQKLGYNMHILMCGNCRRYIQQFRTMLKKARTLRKAPLTDSQAQDIVDKVKLQQTDKPQQ